MRHESILKAALCKQLKITLPGGVLLTHQDLRTSGIPDVSLTAYGRTSWIEIKHGTPQFDSTGIQELTMLRLAGAGFARYVIYLEKGDLERTLIVHPKNLASLVPECEYVGFNHVFVARYFQEQLRP